jgi:guanine deaminase
MGNRYLSQVIELAAENARSGRGGPFAALVVKDGAVVATGVNSVSAANDPTAHAEVMAIRAACRALGSFQLDGCELYSSCEPCPMCLGAIYWARPARVYYAATCQQAADAGFDDSYIYQQFQLPHAERAIPMLGGGDPEEALRPFREWLASARKVTY